VAGSLTILWAIVILLYMPPDPIRAKGFNERERYIAVARMRTNNSGVRNTHFKKEQVLEALLDVKFWLVFSASFLLMIANGPVSTFIPIIISSFGFKPLHSLLLVMPAGAIVGTIELLVPMLAYKFINIRTWLAVVCQLGTIMGSLLLWLLPREQKGGLLFGTYFLASFGGAYVVLMGLQVANTAGYTKRSVTSSGIFIGYCLGMTRPLPGFLIIPLVSCDNANRTLLSSRQLRRPAALQAGGCPQLCSWIHCCSCDVNCGSCAHRHLSLRCDLSESQER
jgi:hypothetical protein